MTSTAAVLLGIAGIAAVVDWAAVTRRAKSLEYVAKPAVMVALLAVALAVEPSDPTRRAWFVAALAFSLAGDVFLMLRRERFLAGLFSFLVAHLCYIAGLLAGGPRPVPALIAVAIIVPLAVLVGRPIISSARRRDPGLAGAGLGYLVVISLMVVSAVASGPLLAVLGAIAFMASDTVLAWDRFVDPFPQARLLVIVSYHLAQALLVVSLISIT